MFFKYIIKCVVKDFFVFSLWDDIGLEVYVVFFIEFVCFIDVFVWYYKKDVGFCNIFYDVVENFFIGFNKNK